MKKYLPPFLFLGFLIIFIFAFELPIFAIPSFEIYEFAGTKYPTLLGSSLTGPDEDDFVAISASVFDVSGVVDVMVTIKKPPSTDVVAIYHLDRLQGGTGWDWNKGFYITNYEDGNYTVDISATDMLGNNSAIEGQYKNVENFTVGTGSEDWLAGWPKRKKITIDATGISSSLAGFPLYIRIFDDANMAIAQNKGKDIRFTDSGGTNLLPYERESWSGGAGGNVTADFWVKVPVIARASTTDIYIYYGKSGGSDGEDAENVWDSHYRAVYHLNGISGNNWSDSTSNSNDGHNNGATQIAGKVSGAANFSNSSIVSQNDIGIGGNSAFTIEAWVLPGDNPHRTLFDDYGSGMIGWGSTGCTYGNFIYYDSSENNFEVGFYCNDNQTYEDYPKDYWYNPVVKYNGTDNKMFVDGSEVSFAQVWPGGINFVNSPLSIGVDPFGQSRYYNGVIDEVRISDTARSADWIKFEYDNIKAAGHKINFNGEETS